MTEIALIDLSSIAYPIFLTSAAEPDPNAASTKMVERVRSLTANHLHAAICCDKGKSFRAEIDPSYKAQREAAPAALYHQIALAKEQLEADGYPVWWVPGFEADDLIATAAMTAVRAPRNLDVLIVSADKDLLYLVGPHLGGGEVRVLSPASGNVYDLDAVEAKFGIKPWQMRDYLALVGDSADNVKGAKGVGPVKAKELLRAYGDLEAVYESLSKHPVAFKPALATALKEFDARRATVCQLITLRTDAPIPFEEVTAERAPRNVAPMEEEMSDMGQMTLEEAKQSVAAVVGVHDAPRSLVGALVEHAAASGAVAALEAMKPGPPVTVTEAAAANVQALGMVKGQGQAIESTGLAPAPVEFERQLEPRSLGQAFQLANQMYQARMFNGYGTAQAVLSTVLAGRELGLQAIASLRAFHVIEGKHALAADAMRGLVLRSGAAKYFRIVERTAEIATFETWRKDEPEPVRLSYTIAEGRAAFVGDDLKWSKSSWGKHPADMLAARASSKLARLVYADILFGLYAPEELTEGAA